MPLTLDFGHGEHVNRFVIGSDQNAPITGQRNDAVHYLQVVALVLTIYDHSLTFDREVQYIWSRDWSISAILYIMTRYGGNMMLGECCIFESTCNTIGDIGMKIIGAAALVIILLSQVVMQLRIKTLYRRNVTTMINILWGVEILAAVAIGTATTYFIEVSPLALGSMEVCTVIHFPAYASAFWFPVLLFESFLFVLAFRIAWYNHYQLGSWRAARLLHVVLRDNFSFFVLVFIAYLLTAIVWLVAGPQYFLVPAMLSCSLTTVMGCRFILNLFQAYHSPRGITIDSVHTWPPIFFCGLQIVGLPDVERRPRPSVLKGGVV